jgi:ribosomal small subunit protein bTHX
LSHFGQRLFFCPFHKLGYQFENFKFGVNQKKYLAMGKGDKKTTKGKRFRSSYGNTRKKAKSTFSASDAKPKKEAKSETEKKETKTTAKKTATKKAPAKKAAAKKETA